MQLAIKGISYNILTELHALAIAVMHFKRDETFKFS